MRKEPMRERILKILEDSDDPERTLTTFIETTAALAQGCFLLGELDITQHSHFMNLKDIHDTSETLLGEIRKAKGENEERDQ